MMLNPGDRFIGDLSRKLIENDTKEIKNNYKEINIINNPELTTKILKINNYDKITRLKLINESTNKQIDTSDIYILLENKKIKQMESDSIVIDFDTPVEKEYGNKTTFELRFKINDKLIIDEILSNRSVTIFSSYIDKDVLITFAKTKEFTMKELKKTLGKNSSLNSILKIASTIKYSDNLQLTSKSKELIITNQYLNSTKFMNCETYKDVFKVAKEIYEASIDVNYIKSILLFTNEMYQMMQQDLEDKREV
jgi:hypothetical protein